jgi:hypothetical protein
LDLTSSPSISRWPRYRGRRSRTRAADAQQLATSSAIETNRRASAVIATTDGISALATRNGKAR